MVLSAAIFFALPTLAQQKADRILIIKSQHRMTLYAGDKVLHTYRIAIGRVPKVPKLRRGDHKTPEGDYIVDAHKQDSRFDRALHLSYPDPQDRARANAAHVPPGEDIMIHGLQNGLGWLGSMHRLADWTDGCIAVSDKEIEEIYTLVPNGAKVHIEP